MVITPINPISNCGDASSQNKKNLQPNNRPPTAGASITEKLMHSVLRRSEHGPEYEQEAFNYLRSFYRKNGPAFDSYIQCQINFVLAVRVSQENIVLLNPLYDKMKESAFSFKKALTEELSSMQSAGLDNTNARVDVLIGLQHLYGNASCAAFLCSELFLTVSPEKRADVLNHLEAALQTIVEIQEKLSTLSKHPENANQFLFSEISAQQVDKKV